MHWVKYAYDNVDGNTEHFENQTDIVQHFGFPMVGLMVNVENEAEYYCYYCRYHLWMKKHKKINKKLQKNTQSWQQKKIGKRAINTRKNRQKEIKHSYKVNSWK